MAMIKLNLLSDQQKKERDTEKKIGVVVRLGFSAIFAFLVLALVMLFALIILEINLKSVKEEAKAAPVRSDKEIEETENLLKEVEDISKKIVQNSGTIPHWGKVIKLISENSPEGIRISNIHIEKEHIRLIGFAKTREEFLSFQETLRNDNFKNLNSPVSNLVSPKDFPFTVDFDVEKKYLNEP